MKIAFASCLCAPAFPQQPVWDRIRAERPDHVVLLGDTIYIDIFAPDVAQRLSTERFAALVHQRYRQQLAVPQFDAMLRALPPGRVHAIWDDHDFLWNDACGAAVIAMPTQRDKLHLSNAFFKAFRQALVTPGSFPDQPTDPRFGNPAEPAPPVLSLQLDPLLHLHLSDSRSWRTETLLVGHDKRQLLGEAQRGQLQQAIAQAHPDAVHLLANGSTSSDWKKYPTDWQWLKGQAAARRTLLVSGDIHYNDVDQFDTGGRFPLHEATSSAAALRSGIVAGEERQNFGLLDVRAGEVELRLFDIHGEQQD
uniref:alkaline phosphatase D family protein n=1 Tax=Pelomonas sp. KK5 TaxID=1855730 RepID=UPI00097C15BD